ncbi:MAG TPA: 16S rRNA (guanine(966)-N(2))-methyltransferase RsmD, partial [Acidobacteriaceae bacterium]|nr:16S rRNA (guanine(966)-N(2))-methyltransferase RsmD [Acidobacteriaceae bacterium]
MRVIGGEYRSRPLVAPRGLGTRPTSDRLRETLFNVLGPRLQGARFADLYAGSGAVGIEALSRGAAQVLFAESSPVAVAAIRRNLASLGLTQRVAVDARPVRRALVDAAKRGDRFDLIFLDPPYEAAEEYLAALGGLGAADGPVLADGALVIAEHARRSPLAQRFG